MTSQIKESGLGPETETTAAEAGISRFRDFLKRAGKEIEEETRKYFAEFASGTVENIFVREVLQELARQNEGGKRIRGALIKLGEQIASHGAGHNYLPIAVGYELFQTSVLIHDDIIDRSDTRRGRVTIHIDSAERLKGRMGSEISEGETAHYGVSRALCAGDYGFFLSYQFLARCEADSAVMAKVYRLYSQILTMTCEGEIMDTMLPFEKMPILEQYAAYEKTVSQIYELKTAWYTLAGPLMLGAACGGGSDELAALLKNIALPLGIAFQIKDDLLGIYSSDEELGKPVLSDIREGKQTFLLGAAYKNADEAQRALLDRHYGNKNADAHDLEIVRRLFEETGAKRYAEEEIRRLSEQSKALIQNDLIEESDQTILYGLAAHLAGRTF